MLRILITDTMNPNEFTTIEVVGSLLPSVEYQPIFLAEWTKNTMIIKNIMIQIK